MALIQEAMQPGSVRPGGPAQQMPPQAPGAQPGAAQGGQQAVQELQRLGVALMLVIYDKKIFPQLLNIIRGSEDPVAGVVQAALIVMKALGEKVKGINPNVVQKILPPALAFLFEMAEAAKLLKFEPAMMEQAKQMLAQQLGGQQQAQAAPAQQPQVQAEEAPAVPAQQEA